MKKQILLIFFLCFTIIMQSQVTKNLNVTAGGLSKSLTSTDISTVTNLTLTGTIDVRDFRTMQNMYLVVLDMSNVSIDAYTGTQGNLLGNNVYPANTIQPFSNSLCGECLKSITIPLTVTSIGDYAFCGCSSLTSISIPSGVTSIGKRLFYGCTRLTSITIPSSVTSIGNEVFYDCRSLTSITIPSGVTSIGNENFYGCSSLTSITIPSSVTSIGRDAFKGCTILTSLIIPSSVTSIGTGAFFGCSGLTTINIPLGISSIGQGTFEKCESLTSIIIPSSVISIGDYAFFECSSLTSIYAYAAIPINLDSNTFNGVHNDGCTLFVPKGSISAYKTAYYWKDFANIVEMTIAK